MISIVVCHRDVKLLDQFKKSVQKTIGVEFEFVIINNQNNPYNIFEAYNLGIERSQYDIICFAHEDLIFHTENWGKKVIQHFDDEKTGMIGVIGGNAFPACPSPWWNSEYLNDHLIHNIQHWNEGYVPSNNPNKKPLGKNKTLDLHNPYKENKTKAVTLDGLWMCAHRKVFDECRFDDKTFNGFHCYDTDICLQVNQKYDIYVVFDILMEHLSMGSVKKEWAEAALTLANKWKNQLPIICKDINEKDIDVYNAKCLLTYCYWVKGMAFDNSKIKLIIKDFLPITESYLKSKELLLLKLWSVYGYTLTRIIYKILKYGIKK